MIVIRKKVGKWPQIIDVENTLEALQEEVGGYIETVTFAEDACIICDEEGRLKDKPHNVNLFGVDFVGTVLAVGVDGENFRGFDSRELGALMLTFIKAYNVEKERQK